MTRGVDVKSLNPWRKVEVIPAGIVAGDRGPREGVHLSDVIFYASSKLDPSRKRTLNEMDYHRFALGESFEAGVLAAGILFNYRAMHEELWKQYTFEVDEIRMSLDGVDFANQPPLVVESKCTWYGTKRGPDDSVFQAHWWQTKGYALGVYLERKEMPDVRMIYGHMMGDYSWPIQPEIRCYDRTYTKNDLTKSWDFIRRTRDEMIKDKTWRKR